MAPTPWSVFLALRSVCLHIQRPPMAGQEPCIRNVENRTARDHARVHTERTVTRRTANLRSRWNESRSP